VRAPTFFFVRENEDAARLEAEQAARGATLRLPRRSVRVALITRRGP
jgi:hypothetical protein